MKSFVSTLSYLICVWGLLSFTPSNVSWAEPKPQTLASTPHSAGSPPLKPSSAALPPGSNLPLYSLSLAQPLTKGIQVGDVLEFRFDSPPRVPFHVQDSSSLFDEGWDLDQERSVSGSLFVMPLRSGQVQLPSLTLLDEKGESIGQTQALPLEVKSALTPEEKQAVGDAIGPIPPLGVQFPLWILLLGALLVGALLAGILFAWKRRKVSASVATSPQDLRTEDEVAFDELNDLRTQHLLEKNRYKEFYFSLSEILKKYVGSRYQFHAREATALEILLTFKKDLFLEEHFRSDLEKIFDHLDQVKFTDYRPEVQEGYRVFEDVKNWVTQTKKQIQVIQPQQSEGEAKKHASL